MNRSEILERREKVKKLMLSGIVNPAIARSLKMSLSTVKRDVRAIKEQVRKEITALDAGSVLSMLVMEYNNVIKEMWKNYVKAEEHRKPRILSDIVNAIKEKSHTFYKFGFEKIPEIQVEVKQEFNMTQLIKNVKNIVGEEIWEKRKLKKESL